MESILTSIKKLLGIEEDVTHFDTDIIIYINSTLLALNQMGVGPTEGFTIIDKTATWVNFLGERKDIEAVKQYIYLKVRLVFDPPTNSFLIESIERIIKELEWRISIHVDPPIVVEPIIEEGGV